MNDETVQILNIKNVRTGGMQDLLAFCDSKLRHGEGVTLVPINPIKVIKARRRPEFQAMIDQADWVFADASGIRMGAKLLHGIDLELCPGWQTMLALLEQCQQTGRSVYFLGTTDEILSIALERLHQKYPRLTIAGQHHGFFSDEEEPALLQQIAETKPDYVFVAMGEYRQELVLERIRKLHPAAVYQGVGGSLDLVAGRQPMPPAWIRRHHLEWLFRAIRQPFRLPRFKALPIYAALVIQSKLTTRPHATSGDS